MNDLDTAAGDRSPATLAPLWRRLTPAAVATVVLLSCACVPSARAAEAGDVSEGMRLYQQKGNCQACHGWAGDGRKMDSQMPDGANLRESKLDRASLVMVVKCGLPGTGMPAFDRLAYSDGRCYGMKQADLAKNKLTMGDPPATLQPREIDTLVDFMVAKIVGKGRMNRAQCADYWGSEADVCREIQP